ncbi:hypothetical protein K438DRAFT_1782135 [Mycena galopus ATCC 62051]|nr:hypothetical protein K438DRAFT_1782135 [Mycena galopus ATCC 62051]
MALTGRSSLDVRPSVLKILMLGGHLQGVGRQLQVGGERQEQSTGINKVTAPDFNTIEKKFVSQITQGNNEAFLTDAIEALVFSMNLLRKAENIAVRQRKWEFNVLNSGLLWALHRHSG